MSVTVKSGAGCPTTAFADSVGSEAARRAAPIMRCFRVFMAKQETRTVCGGCRLPTGTPRIFSVTLTGSHRLSVQHCRTVHVHPNFRARDRLARRRLPRPLGISVL